MTAAWHSVPLRNVLVRSTRTITLEPNASYREVKVRMNGKGVVERRVVKGSEIASDSRFIVKAGQFIISRIDARHGASGLIPEELEGAVVTNDFPVFDVKKDQLNPQFFGWMTKAAPFIELCRLASEGTTNRVRLVEQRFMSLPVALPSLPEQLRIVMQIETLANKSREAGYLRELAVSELKVFERSASRRVFERLRGQPVPLESICAAIIDNLHSTPDYSGEGVVPCIRSPDVGYGTLDLEGARKTSEQEYARRTVRGEPQPDDIVLVREGGGTGKCALVTSGQRFSLGQRVMMLRPDKGKVHPKFLLHQLLSPVIQIDHILELLKGSASPHLNIGALRRFPFILPPLATQDEVVQELDDFQRKVGAVKQIQADTAAELDAMLPAILDKAFRGEL